MQNESKKIFVISLHRSLTRSTDALISMLGYNTLHFPKFFQGQNLMERVRGKEHKTQEIIEALEPVIETYDCLSDVPIPTLYRQLANKWPNSLFILVNRNPEHWARSAKSLLRKRKLSPFNRIQYEHYFEHKVNKLNKISLLSLIGMHVKHSYDVKQFFYNELKNPNRLCIIDSQYEDVGEKICNFLGHHPRPLPRISDDPENTSFESLREWKRLCPDKTDASYFYARYLQKRKEVGQAKEELLKANDIAGNHPKIQELLSNIYYNEGSLREAKDFAKDSIEKGVLRPRLFYRIGHYYLKNYSFGKSLLYYLQGLKWKIISH